MKKYLTVFLLLITSYIEALSVTPSSWDLGSITNNSGIQSLDIKIHNDTKETIKVDFISTCGCLISDTDTLNLSPNEIINTVFSFDPKDEKGAVSKFMIIRTTQPDLPKALFEVHGEVLGNRVESEANVLKEDLSTDQTGIDQSSSIQVIPIKYYFSEGCISCRKF